MSDEADRLFAETDKELSDLIQMLEELRQHYAIQKPTEKIDWEQVADMKDDKKRLKYILFGLNNQTNVLGSMLCNFFQYVLGDLRRLYKLQKLNFGLNFRTQSKSEDRIKKLEADLKQFREQTQPITDALRETINHMKEAFKAENRRNEGIDPKKGGKGPYV